MGLNVYTTRIFSAADIEKRIRLRNSGISVAAVLKAVINDYKKYQGKYSGTETLRRSFVNDVYAVLGDAQALNSVNIVDALKLSQYGDEVVTCGRQLQAACRKINTIRADRFSLVVNKFINSLWVSIM